VRDWTSYNTHGQKLRCPPSKKAQFLTECGIETISLMEIKMKKMLLLVLTALTLAACASAPTPDLSGAWKLVSYGDASNPTPALPGVDTSIQFEDGQMSGNVGCNGFGGEYELNGNALTFGTVMSTLMFCEGGSDQEQSVLSVFADGDKLIVHLEGDLMTIKSPDGTLVVNLARR
jgi:heat shock protein HslJ